MRSGVLVVALAAGCHGEAPVAPPPNPSTPTAAIAATAPAANQPPLAERIPVPGGAGEAPSMPPLASAPAVDPALAGMELMAEEGRLAIEPPPTTPPGIAATARLRLTASDGYEINEEYHYKLTLDPTPGITLPKSVFTHATHDAERLDTHELAIAMDLIAERPGDYTVRGTLSFAMCKPDSQCRPKSMPVAVQLAAR